MTRLRSSCRACHKSHKKCDGNNQEPCSRCQKRNEACLWDKQQKRGPKRKRKRNQDPSAAAAAAEEEEDYNDYQQREEDDNNDGEEFQPVAAGSATGKRVLNNNKKKKPTSRSNSSSSALVESGGNNTATPASADDVSSSSTNPDGSSRAQKRRKLTSASPSHSTAANQPHNSTTDASSISSSSTSASHAPNLVPIHILLAGTGSVASIKIPELCHKLRQFSILVKDEYGGEWKMQFRLSVIMTDAAARFVSKEKIHAYLNEKEAGQYSTPISILHDEDEWRKWQKIGDQVTHIELRQNADMMLIAPLSANTLAKIANGLCDNLVTCVVRAWDFSEKPLIACPAMNTVMWNNIFTGRHLDTLQNDLGVEVVHPVSKKLACGESGIGALAYVDDILRRSIQVALTHVLQKKVTERGGGKIDIPAEYRSVVGGAPIMQQQPQNPSMHHQQYGRVSHLHQNGAATMVGSTSGNMMQHQPHTTLHHPQQQQQYTSTAPLGHYPNSGSNIPTAPTGMHHTHHATSYASNTSAASNPQQQQQNLASGTNVPHQQHTAASYHHHHTTAPPESSQHLASAPSSYPSHGVHHSAPGSYSNTSGTDTYHQQQQAQHSSTYHHQPQHNSGAYSSMNTSQNPQQRSTYSTQHGNSSTQHGIQNSYHG